MCIMLAMRSHIRVTTTRADQIEPGDVIQPGKSRAWYMVTGVDRIKHGRSGERLVIVATTDGGNSSVFTLGLFEPVKAQVAVPAPKVSS